MNSISTNNLKKAFVAMCKGYRIYLTMEDSPDVDLKEALRDSCIKRFEFTLELARKLMSRYLRVEYGRKPEELKHKNVYRLMEGYGFIGSWEKWATYTEYRNDTAHEYDLDKAKSIIPLLPDFINDVEKLLNKLETDKDTIIF